MSLANKAAEYMEFLCNDNSHGYSQNQRWGDANLGVDTLNLEGTNVQCYRGDRDCSSAVIDACREALTGTEHAGKLNGATYTGNMKDVFLNSGLFEWHDMSFTAQRGDVYLAHNPNNEHCAMCTCANPDLLAEFSISETGGTDGQPGDQTGREAYIHNYYDLPWDGILHWVA